MADQNTNQNDAAAQKAYETAVTAKSDSAKPVKAEAQAELTKSGPAKSEPTKAETTKAEAPKPVEKKTSDAPKAAKPAVKKTIKAKAPAKKSPANNTVAVKPTAKKTTLKKAGAKRTATPKSKDATMNTKTQTKNANVANDMANEMQSRLAGMYEKSTEMTGEMVTFQRANAEAMAEAGKILFTGVQEMTRDAVEEGRKAAGQMSEDARLIAAAKSPTELVKLQSDIMRRSFDSVVAIGSKNTEAWIKLTNEAFAPLTSRVSEAVDKMNKVAA